MFMQLSLTHILKNQSIFEFLHSDTFGFLIVSFYMHLVLAATLYFSEKIAKKVPYNCIILLILTIFPSFILAFLCWFFPEDLLIKFLLVASFVTCGLTGFTFVSKKKPGLFIGTIAVFVFDIVGFLILCYVLTFKGKKIYWHLYIFCFVCVFAYGVRLVFLIDRRAMKMCGETIDEYILAALMIYFKLLISPLKLSIIIAIIIVKIILAIFMVLAIITECLVYWGDLTRNLAWVWRWVSSGLTFCPTIVS